jgi:carboxypeptidase A2
VYAWIDELVAAYPKLLKTVVIGKTFQGKDIRAVLLSSDVGGSNKPRIVYNSCQHAREWVTVTTINWVLNELVINYGKNDTITELVDKIDWTFIPITNIDGFDFSQSSRMWRKTRKTNPGSTCIGVDPNRNWPYMWNRGGSSTNPCSDTFHGPSAGSEPEPMAVANYLKNTPRVMGYMDIHSYSQLFMCPWGWSSSFPPDYSKMMALMQPIAAEIQKIHGRRYTAGSIGGILYIASGNAVDYAYGELKIIHSYTIELRDTGQYGFVLPANQIRPQGEEFMAGVMVMANAIKTEWYSK